MKRAIIIFSLLLLVFCTPIYADENNHYEKIIDKVAEDYIGKTVPGACVMISEKGKPVFVKCYGYADIENKKRIATDSTIIEWGSITKTMVWVSAMQLEERGLLKLNEDIRSYLSEGFLKNLKYEKSITMLDLMNHTAGFEEALIDFRYLRKDEQIELSKVLSEKQPAQIFEPGEISAYSNWGCALAALIVENVSGQPFEEYVKENILIPLNMKNVSITSFLSDTLIEQKANGYSYSPEGFRKEDWMILRMYPAGGLNATAEDLMKYAMELSKSVEKSSLLFQNPETKERLFSRTWSSFGASSGLAHGFWEYAGAPRIFGHEGGTYGFKTQMWVEPEKERAIVIASNVMETDFCSKVMSAITTENSSERVNDSSTMEIKNFEGNYAPARRAYTNPGKINGLMQNIKITSTADGKHIIMKKNGDDKEYIFEPIDKGRFYCKEALAEERYLAFQQEEEEVLSMTFRLAHDYIPAEGLQSFQGILLLAIIFIFCSIVWICSFIWHLATKNRQAFLFPKMLCNLCGIFISIAVAGVLFHWIRKYMIVSAQLNAVAIINYIFGIVIFIASVYLLLKKQRFFAILSLATIILQMSALGEIGFLTILR